MTDDDQARVVARLRDAGCVFAEDEARLLLEVASGERLEGLLARRVAGEPLEHLVGFVDFAGGRYQVSPGVFVPRQRTVTLVEAAVRLLGAADPGDGTDARRVLDLCCGCGALGVAVRDRLDAGVELVAADLSAAAVADARANGVLEAYVGDLFAALPPRLRGRVDLLLLNAPYVPTAAIADMPAEAREHEPRVALDGGPDGLDVQRRALAEAAAWLRPGGALLTETSRQQVRQLRSVARDRGWHTSVVRDDDRGATVLVCRQVVTAPTGAGPAGRA